LEDIKDFKHNIVFRNVSFSYDGTRNVLDCINLTFEKGKKYIIVGPNGSGKTTLLKMLMKRNESYTGNILIDNKNIKDITTASIYSIIALNSQNIFMFDDTIKNNIELYRSFNEEE